MQDLLRFRHDRSTRIPVVRYAIVLFAVTAAVVVAVAVTLDRNASHSNWQQSTTALSGGAHVGVSAFGTLRSNLQVQASQLATSLSLQRAILAQDEDALRKFAASKHAQIVILGGRAIGSLSSGPRIVATAAINDGVRVLARVTVAVPLNNNVLALVRQTTPLPSHAALVLVRAGRVIAGGPRGARAHVFAGRVVFGETEYAAQGTALGVARTSILAVEPVAAINAASDRYRRFVFLAA